MSENNSISFESILLVESNFKRSVHIDYDSDDFRPDVKFDISHQKDEYELQITFDLHFTAGLANDQQINAYIKMIGVFRLPENLELPYEKFAEINGPAILFPFVREHLASLSLKAGLSPILLQPINFVKFASNR